MHTQPSRNVPVTLDWPDAFAKPAKQTLWKWLIRTWEEGLVERNGDGTRKEPHKYQLPGMAMIWHARFLEGFKKRQESGEAKERLPE